MKRVKILLFLGLALALLLVATPVLACVVYQIEVKPGSDPKPINCRSKGNVPVAVLSDYRPATAVDPDSVRLGVQQYGPGIPPLRWADEDVNGDGDLDRIFHFDKQELCGLLSGNGDTTLWLSGCVSPGGCFWASDTVSVKGK